MLWCASCTLQRLSIAEWMLVANLDLVPASVEYTQ
jgi:hypothetical protein